MLRAVLYVLATLSDVLAIVLEILLTFSDIFKRFPRLLLRRSFSTDTAYILRQQEP